MNIGTLIPLPAATRGLMGMTHILRLVAADIAAVTSGTAQAVVPNNALAGTNTFPAGMVITRAVINVVTAFAFSGGNTGTLTLSLGDGGSSTRFINAADLKTVAWGTGVIGAAYVYAAADTIDIVATAAVQAITLVNAGQVDIYLRLDDASTLVTITEPNAS